VDGFETDRTLIASSVDDEAKRVDDQTCLKEIMLLAASFDASLDSRLR
jgi:hypothetical protein